MTEITNILDGMPLDIEAERRILEILRPFIGRSNTPELREQMCDALLHMGNSLALGGDSEQPCGYVFGGCTFIPAGSSLLTETILSESTAVYWAQIVKPVKAPDNELAAWESTTTCYTKFISDKRYHKLSPEARRWYKPFRCTSCNESDQPPPPQEHMEGRE